MAWTTPQTWVSGDQTASNFNTHIRDNLNALGGQGTVWTPTLTQSGAVTKTVTYARANTVGGWCKGYCRLDVTGSGTGNNAITVTTPTTAITTGLVVGSFLINDADASTGDCVGVVRLLTTGTFDFAIAGAASVGVTPNFALASGDVIQFHFDFPIL